MADGINNFFQSLSGRLGSSIGNPVAQERPQVDSGNLRKPFLDPKNVLSSTLTNIPGVNRTIGSSIQQLTETRRDGTDFLQKPGFTPLNYFKTDSGEVVIKTPKNTRTTGEYLQEIKDQYSLQPGGSVTQQGESSGDTRLGSFRFSLDDFSMFFSGGNFFGTDGSNNRDLIIGEYLKDQASEICYYDNEDPVYFGFEVIINDLTSPLFNGMLDQFIEQFQTDISEIGDRKFIYNQFKNEIKRYFKFKSDLNNSSSTQIDSQDLIFATCNKPRRYYVKKISGLDSLVERNSGDAQKSFIDYNKEKINLTFFEDTTLNLGTLAVLYKSLYWSKNHGKSIIPENLLRFDCEIVVSELRNFSRIKKSQDALDEIRSNLSRYVYKVYECQFFFNNMSHPSEIDMSSGPNVTEDYTIPFNFKFSNMIFERWNPLQEVYRTVRDDTFYPSDPLQGDSRGVTSTLPNNDLVYDRNISYNYTNVDDQSATTIPPNSISAQKAQFKFNIYQSTLVPIPSSGSSNNNPSLFKRAGQQLLENLKDTALNETQRQLNIRFRLLNDSINRIRDQFGIGQIPAPTNVYFPRQNTGPYGDSKVFFDVQNSLRNFGGDILTGLIGGR